MYYNIRLESEPKIIGVKNGIYQVDLDKKAYDKQTFKELESLFVGGEFSAQQFYPEINFKFYFKKLKSAKKTNFMSFCPNFNHGHFLVNEKVMNVFEQFNMQRHKYFETVIYDSPTENLDNSYSLYYSVLQDWNVIDFDKTVFTSGGFGNFPKIEHSFNDENDMRAFDKLTHVKTLVLLKNFDSTLDLFHTRLGGVFVSERLKIALEQANLTGILFTNKIDVII